jgi:hypothetical protein
MINVEYDGLSSKLDLSKVTGIPGMSIKLCIGQGSTNAQPLFETATPYADGDFSNVEEVTLGGFIIEPYNDGQIITKAMIYRAFDVPGQDMNMTALTFGNATGFDNYGNMDGAVFSALIDGLTEEGYFADAKVFGSIGWSKSNPDAGNMMLGSADSETGTSYWFGAYLPVTVEDEKYGTVGLEYNHGSKYWRPFTYGEDTMIGSKLAARGDAWEANWTYQINEALSVQLRYVAIDYDYTGSNGFFGNYSGSTTSIKDIKLGESSWDMMSAMMDPVNGLDPTSHTDIQSLIGVSTPNGTISQADAYNMAAAKLFAPNVVEAAKDFRFYIRYRF